MSTKELRQPRPAPTHFLASTGTEPESELGHFPVPSVPALLGVATSVKLYGATGDGTTDDRSALQSAIDAVGAGGVLYVPPGTYRITRNASTSYCLRVMASISIVFAPGATLQMATTVPSSVAALQIGDGSTAFSNVLIDGGKIDGNAVANGGSYGVGAQGISITGPVSRVAVRNMIITNCLGCGFVASGTSSASRCKQINVENCDVTFCGEGVRFEKCDNFHWRGGQLTDILAQDCFEPHGALENWSLRDCYIARPHPSNSAIEVYPQHGNIIGGLIENCVILDDEIRVSIGSGTSSESNTVFDVVVQRCYFKNSHAYLGAGGKCKNITFQDNTFEGPTNCPRSVPNEKSGINCYGGGNQLNAIGNKISGYQGAGIFKESGDYGKIIGNEIFNNAQNPAIVANFRRGMRIGGNKNIISGNIIYDDQETPTQLSALTFAGNDNVISGNHSWGQPGIVNTGLSPTGHRVFGNTGTMVDRISATITIAAGTKETIIDVAALGVIASAINVASITPIGNYSPAVRYWLSNISGVVRLNTDVNLTNNGNFRVVWDLSNA